jgi:hypothetical protein
LRSGVGFEFDNFKRVIAMTSRLQHPVLILAALGAVSGVLGTTFLGAGYGDAPDPGVYMVLAGLWFGLVIGFAVRRWGEASWGAVATAVLVTWIGWEVAINVALKIDRPWPEAISIASIYKSYLAGFVAGALGAAITWAGAAARVLSLQRVSAAATITATGAMFGLLLPATNHFDSGLVLQLPWQVAVASMIGFNLSPRRKLRRPDHSALAV